MILVSVALTVIAAIVIAIKYTKNLNLLTTVESVVKADVNQWLSVFAVIGVACAMIFVLFKRRKNLFAHDLQTPNKTIPIKLLISLVLLLLMVQFITGVWGIFVETVANFLGYTLFSAPDSINQSNNDWILLIYSSLLAPVTEEIVFRGVILSGLKKYGKVFAIITSAILFAFTHGNFVQGLLAFCSGLIFGYVSTEYAIKWAIVLHIINNLFINNFVIKAIGMLPLEIQPGVCILFILAGVYILFINRVKIKNYLANNKSPQNTYFIGWTSAWFIIYLGFQLASALTSFIKIE